MRGKIIIEADELGETQIRVEGVKGDQCLEVTKPFEEILGKVVKREVTEEFNERPTHQQQIRQ